MSWREKIEAQIAELRKHEEQTPLDQNEMNLIDACGEAADTMQALLDVAVAAVEHLIAYRSKGVPYPPPIHDLSDAFDKLREDE